MLDINRQAQSSSATALVHPAWHYVGVKASRSFGVVGKPYEVEVVVVDVDGQLVEGAEVPDREWTLN